MSNKGFFGGTLVDEEGRDDCELPAKGIEPALSQLSIEIFGPSIPATFLVTSSDAAFGCKLVDAVFGSGNSRILLRIGCS